MQSPYSFASLLMLVGFTADIGAQAGDLNDAVSLFFITFVTLQPFSAAAGRYIGANNWIPVIMVGGVCNTNGHVD
jgi:hypothetical protein